MTKVVITEVLEFMELSKKDNKWNIPKINSFTTTIYSMPTLQNITPLFPKRGRKKKERKINYTPTLTIREPTDGIKDTEIVKLGHDELEALRLKQINGLGIISAAKQMGISKSLFAKIYNDAVRKVSNALIYGKSLHIEVVSGTGMSFKRPLL